MYNIGDKWLMRAEIIPFQEAIRLEKEAGKFGLFSEAQQHGLAPPTAAVVSAWLQPSDDAPEVIKAAGALQQYHDTLVNKITASYPHQHERG